MVGMGFRRIALAQGLLDGPLDRNNPMNRNNAARPDRDWSLVDREPMLAPDNACKDTTAARRVHLGN
jgi:hypothetical protein